jgi:hypothetical protein
MASISSIRISMNHMSNIFDITVTRIVHLIVPYVSTYRIHNLYFTTGKM